MVLGQESNRARDFTVREDVWIGNVEQRRVNPEDATAGAYRLKKGERITSERARSLGLLADEKAQRPAEDKAEHAAEDKAEKPKAKK